jgi:hypothetical protein
MPYRISKADIEKIADVLPDAYIIENGGESVDLVLQGSVDPTSVNLLAQAIDEEKIEDYLKTKRQQLIEEVREIQSFKASVEKRVLCAIVNDAVRSIHN